MIGKLAHRINPDGTVTIMSWSEGSTESARALTMTANVAKRFAWGLLADLDPDEAAALLTPNSDIIQPVVHRPRSASSTGKLLRALADGPKTGLQLAAAVNLTSGIVAARMTRLRDAGLAARIDHNLGHRGRATYALTSTGRVRAAA